MIGSNNAIYGVVGSKFELEREGMGISDDLERWTVESGFHAKTNQGHFGIGSWEQHNERVIYTRGVKRSVP